MIDIVGDVPLIYAERTRYWSRICRRYSWTWSILSVPDSVPQTEENDIMHEDLRDALDTQEDSSYEMEEEVENQIYYDIEELLKEI